MDSTALGGSGALRGGERAISRLVQLQRNPGCVLFSGCTQDARDDLALLVRQGTTALPAIRDYLRSSSDLDPSVGGFEELGYGSLRLALFDVLNRIGGDRAANLWYETLATTRNPTEIETLGRYLERYDPGLYRRDIVAAARRAFELAVSGAGLDQDAGPLFRVFHDFGDTHLIPELEQVSPLRWGSYAAVALAGLPDGQGLSSLARQAEGAPATDLSARFALQMLAQSAEYPEARAALIDGVRTGQIPETLWPDFASLLAGTYRIQLQQPGSTASLMHANDRPRAGAPVKRVRKLVSYTPGGGQVLYGLEYTAPTLTNDQIIARLDLVDALLQEAPSPAARQALKRVSDLLWSSYQER